MSYVPGGDYGSYYPPTSPLESYGDPDEGRCCEDRICSCLGKSLDSIAVSVALIAEYLKEKTDKPCDHIEDCMEKIIEALRKKFEGPLYSCQQCDSMLANGMGGTFEYAIRCANVRCDECNTVCTLADPSSEGQCCKGCGKSPCCCKDGTCVPCGEEQEPTTKWIGWCYPPTGSIAVTKQGEPSPGAGFVQVALSDSEQAAATEAAANCKQAEKIPGTPQPSPPLTDKYPTVACDFKEYLYGRGPIFAASRYSLIQQIGSSAQGVLAESQFGIGGLNIDNAGQMLYGFLRYFTGGEPFIAGRLLPAIVDAFGCNNSTFRNALSAIVEFQYMNRALGIDLSAFQQPWHYTANLSCPTKFIGPNEALTAYLSRAIDKPSLQTLWAMNGYCAENIDWAVQSAKSKPVQLQLASMRRRKFISDSGYQVGMREIGFLEPSTNEHLFRLTEQVPTLQDIIRFMVRDADDTQGVVAKFDLDAKFNEKYPVGGKLREWAEWQGVPEDAARYAWRAHWAIPSPGQLFHFYHRLRKDDKYPRLLDDIKDALIQQDILPFWHEHYLSTSFLPIGRIDIRRAYNVGAVKDDDLPKLYSQLGYSDDTSATLSRFTRRLRDAALPNHRAVKQWTRFAIDRPAAERQLSDDGIPGEAISKAMLTAEPAFASSVLAKAYVRGDMPRQQFTARLINQGVSQDGATKIANQLGLQINSHVALADFAAGVLTKDQAGSEMRAYGIDQDVTERMLSETSRKIRASFIMTCQKGLKRRYLLGDLDKGEAINQLTVRGTNGERARELVDWWDCERSSSGRAVAANRLCEWLGRGAITANDFRRRLENIGYTKVDAELMVEDCLIAISVKRLREAEKEAKDNAAQRQRIERAIAQAAASSQREFSRAVRANEQARIARLNRDKQLTSAIEKLGNKVDFDLFTRSQFIKSEKSRIQREYALHVDEALQALLKGVEDWQGGELSDLSETFNGMAQAIVTSNNPPQPDRTVYSANSNGSTQPLG